MRFTVILPIKKPFYMDIAIEFVKHFLSLIASPHHKIHTDCPIMIYEDSTWLDEEHIPGNDGPKGQDMYRGTI